MLVGIIVLVVAVFLTVLAAWLDRNNSGSRLRHGDKRQAPPPGGSAGGWKVKP